MTRRAIRVRRPGRSGRRIGAIVAACAALVGGIGVLSTALAQWRVNNQIYGSSSPSIKYGPQVNGRVYTPASTSRAMPSEVRHAYWKSGDLPSTVRMNYAQTGPMAPSGPIAYVTPPPTKSRSVTSGNYVDTRVGARGPAGTVTTPTSGSVRHAGVSSQSSFAQGATVKTPVPAASGGGGTGAPTSAKDVMGDGFDWAAYAPTGGSVRYADVRLVMPKHLPPAPADPLRNSPASTAPAARG